MQNVKIISGDALKDLQNENIIIVADENNREIGKLINDNGFVLLSNERGKENVQILPKPDKQVSGDVKVEVKEETAENGLSAHDYDEIERKLEEICNSENETDNSNHNKDSPRKISNHLTETEDSFSLEDLENGLDMKDSSSQDIDSETSSIRTGTKRKRKLKSESHQNRENGAKTSQPINKSDDIQFTGDVSDIINDLEAESSVECNLQQSNYVVADQDSQSNISSKPIIKNNVPVKFKKDVVNRPVQKKTNNVTNANNVMSSDKLNAKLSVQGEVIERLTSQLIMYKDMERKMNNLTQELENKNKEIEMLTCKLAAKKILIEKKPIKSDSTDLKDASEVDLRNRIDFLEDNNKKLMKTVTLEGQNRRKLECQVKSRDNQIKELNWKLEKASKFLDRAEKNANNYRKKMLSMQALIRRKKLLNEKTNNVFDEFLVSQSNQSFTDNTLQKALEIEKLCGFEGYQKLLNYEFPLPSLKELSKAYPEEIEYFELEEEENIDNREENMDNKEEESIDNKDEESMDNKEADNSMEEAAVDIKMENVEYLESEFLDDSDETITGTVQDIFNENSDSEDFNLNELKKHIMIELDSS